MAHINYKNKLQEYCQKTECQLPIYLYDSIGTNDKLQWRSTVNVVEKSFQSAYHHNKKQADQEVSQIAYDDIFIGLNKQVINVNQQAHPQVNPYVNAQVNIQQTPHVNAQVNIQQTPHVNNQLESKYIKFIVLIDLENIQPTIPRNIHSAVQLHGFLSTYAKIKINAYTQCIIHKIDSSCSEAADHLLTFKAAQLAIVEDPHTTTFIIVSGDKSSDIICKLLNTMDFNIVHYKTKHEIEEFFTKI